MLDGLMDGGLPSERIKSKTNKAQSHRKLVKTLGDDESNFGTKMNFAQKLKGLETRDTGKESVMNEAPEFEDYQKGTNDKAYNSHDNINPVEISKKILIDCNFIKTKPQAIRTLHPGEGHMSFLPLKSNREIYQDVLHRDLLVHPRKKGY